MRRKRAQRWVVGRPSQIRIPTFWCDARGFYNVIAEQLPALDPHEAGEAMFDVRVALSGIGRTRNHGAILFADGFDPETLRFVGRSFVRVARTDVVDRALVELSAKAAARRLHPSTLVEIPTSWTATAAQAVWYPGGRAPQSYVASGPR